MLRARLALERHRLSVAEPLLQKALDDDGPLAIEARETLVTMYKMQGRYDEARRLVRDGWTIYPDRVGTLQQLARLDSSTPMRREDVEPVLEKAHGVAPDDDRVWLGLAHVATGTGQFDEARKWLDGCLHRRPDDPVVWSARLEWAKAAQDEAEVKRALAHLPADRLTPVQVLSLGAWFARRSGDSMRERRALEKLIELDPYEIWAIKRFAEFLLESGSSAKADKLRHRKGELEKALGYYVSQIFTSDRLDHASELARAAEKVGRFFEARCWWELASDCAAWSREAREGIARLDRARAAAGPSPSHPTPSELLAELESATPPNSAAQTAPVGGALPQFTDDAEAAGLRFTYETDTTPGRPMPLAHSGGVGLLDYDRDGWIDVYVVQGGQFPPPARSQVSLSGGRVASGGDRLFRNRGDGTFEDVSDRAGISALSQGYGHGVAVGDVDNDGWPDLFITRWQSYALLRNRGDGTFEDVTKAWGLAGDRDWPTSAALADFDGDGRLDLYVCHYCEWDSQNPPSCYDQIRKLYSGCGPMHFRALPDHLFRNDGKRFVDVTAEAVIIDTDGRGLGVVAADFDGDGRTDIFVANDMTAKFLFLNRGGMRFAEVGQENGIAGSATGSYQASMGIASGDFDGDGRPDLAVTNYYNEYTAFYRNLGGGVFADHTGAIGLMVPSRYRLGFGISFLDVNNDGRLDLATANGHVDDFRPGTPFQMRAQLFASDESGLRLVDVTDQAGPPFQVPLLGRGLAVGDLDNDGRVDFLIVSQNQPLSYFHNQTKGGHWLTLRLEGGPSNRDAVGAAVCVLAGGRGHYGWRVGGGSYQSASDPRLHFGLGTSDLIESVKVTWPSGKVGRYHNLAVDRGYLLRERDDQAWRLAGFKANDSSSTRH